MMLFICIQRPDDYQQITGCARFVDRSALEPKDRLDLRANVLYRLITEKQQQWFAYIFSSC